ncbi:penicillin-binding protein 2 [Streptomyces sp. WMMC500]|uniref:peptidoglycan D,D-transpeptidase FtsI family protein n=1 Tax=Streptomyces sp. WMMC500 TaxID=3015154 RepID=UPI00248BEFBB|nr:penicillin-binding protein 2 [Streptomyces sp. WMMC500]WBB59896.1 penicillin-binding protein 2 [Streptomyces sp. WMMC500]
MTTRGSGSTPGDGEGPPRRRVPRPASGAGARPRTRASSRPAPQRRPAAGRGPRIRLASPRPRLRLVSVGLTLLLLVFTARLLQVQAVDAGEYAEKAQVNRYVPMTLSAERGVITDRNGVELASTVDAYDVTADPYLFTREQAGVKDAPRRAAEVLAPVLRADADELEAKLATPDSRYVKLASMQTPQVWDEIKKLKSASAEREAAGGRQDVLGGVFAEEQKKRVYPNGDLAAGILGFVNAEGEGGGGVERQHDKLLAGKDGRLVYAQSAGRRIPTADAEENPAEPGSDIELTLDRDIQWAAQSAIEKQVDASDADRGYVIVQDTATGEILAMANAPGFDPNDLSGATPGTLGNPALEDAYEPGSVNKVISMAAVLEEEAATPETRVTVPNVLPRGGHAFHDDVEHPTWYLTLNGVLAKSSNIGTILAVEQLGENQREANKVLHSYLRDFGLGRPSGLGFAGETPGLLKPAAEWDPAQQYTIPFGQGLSINAMQAASVYSTVANGGVRIEPTLVRGSRGPDGRFDPAPEPRKDRVISGKTARTLSRMLESVVDDDQGTGVKARIPGYRAAGKTGTSNRVDPQTGRYNGYTASFAGFAPADAPRVTVYCAIQNPTEGSYFGGQICGPVYKKVMEFALKTLQVPPTGVEAPPMPVTFGAGTDGTDGGGAADDG